MSLPDGLVVFSDDWGRHPSSSQHLVRELLPRYRVWWFNTIGTRRPRFDLLTLRRGLEKIGGWARRTRASAADPNPRVVDPVMWPTFASRPTRLLNRRLLERALRRQVPYLSRAMGVTTVPIVADLVGRVPLARWVYYCVDDLAEWPGLDRSTLLDMEQRLIDRADTIVAVSERLVERIAERGRRAKLLTHGVDRWLWKRGEGELPAYLQALEEPRIVFWGVVDRRLDTSWIAALAATLERGSILLVGPPNNPDPELDHIDRVVRTGPLPFESLPALAAHANALIMPYADTEATRAIQPLKLKEYLASEKPVIVSALPACNAWRDACDVVDGGPEVFAWTVLRRIEEGVSDEQRDARHRLDVEGWDRKAATFESLIWSDGG